MSALSEPVSSSFPISNSDQTRLNENNKPTTTKLFLKAITELVLKALKALKLPLGVLFVGGVFFVAPHVFHLLVGSSTGVDSILTNIGTACMVGGSLWAICKGLKAIAHDTGEFEAPLN